MKRTVVFDIATGPGIPMDGPLYLRPSSRMVDGATVTLPSAEAILLVGGKATIELTVTPEDQSWVWVASEGAGRSAAYERRFLLPEGDSEISYGDTPAADPKPAAIEWGPVAEAARLAAAEAAAAAGNAAESVVAVDHSIADARELVDSIGGLNGIEEKVGRAEAAASNADSEATRAATEANRAVAAADSIDTEALEAEISYVSQALPQKADLTGGIVPAAQLGQTARKADLAVRRRLDPGNSYRKRIVHNLVYQHPDTSAALAAFGGTLYPQAFCIDPTANEILVIGSEPQIVSVYNWTTGAYKGLVYSLGRTGVSEGLVIRYENGSRFLYTVGQPGQVAKFDITSPPAKLSTINPVATYTGDFFNRLTYRDGIWTSTSNTPESGANVAYRNLGRYSKFDTTFNQVGVMETSPGLAGGAGNYRNSTFTKVQGLAAGPGYYAYGVGGGWNPTVTETPYHYQGVRLTTNDGTPIVDSLITASGMMSILSGLGLNPGLVENEGVQVVDDRLYAVYAINSGANPASNTGGILIVEEFSDSPDAVDFSSASASWSVPDTKRIQSGLHVRSTDQKLRDLVTWGELNTLPEIFEYMRAVSQHRFAFYSSGPSILDANGVAIPAGALVEVFSATSETFIVRVADRGIRQFRVAQSGSTWTQLPMSRFTTLGVASGFQQLANPNDPTQVSLEGAWVTLNLGISGPSGGQLPAGTLSPLSSALADEFRPSTTQNFVVPGHTSGVGIRLSITPGGVLTLVGVPASTHNYVQCTVHWRAKG